MSTDIPCTEDLTKSGRVFDSGFLQEMRDYLTAKTVDGHCVTRTQLCEDLELDSKLNSVVGAIINLGHMSGFRIYMGPNGGIGSTDRQPPKKDRAAAGYAPNLSDEEAVKILTKLEELCGAGLIVPRKRVAIALGSPGTKMENLISAALKRSEFNDFATKNGKGGGIYKISMRPDIVRRAARVKMARAPVTPEPEAPTAPEVTVTPAATPMVPITTVASEPTSEPSAISEEGDLSEKLRPIERQILRNKEAAETS